METITIHHARAGLIARHEGRQVASSDSAFLADIREAVVRYATQFECVKVIYKRPSGPAMTSDVTLLWRNRLRKLYTGLSGWISTGDTCGPTEGFVDRLQSPSQRLTASSSLSARSEIFRVSSDLVMLVERPPSLPFSRACSDSCVNEATP
ncbi:hypothetical protein [Paracandidimonas lactea]|uniref:hypothetical protein n=1 Tax=Paracandidimonas lactea TaxID=2895524 RepID=UPI001F1C93F3|nr:hypothetical protein [Paracandidimonas lactea]